MLITSLKPIKSPFTIAPLLTWLHCRECLKEEHKPKHHTQMMYILLLKSSHRLTDVGIKVTANQMDQKNCLVLSDNPLSPCSELLDWKKRSEKESLNLSLSVMFHQVSFTKQSLWQSGCGQHSSQLRLRPRSRDRRGLRERQHDSSSMFLILFLLCYLFLFFGIVQKQFNSLVENDTGVSFGEGRTVTACTELQSL